MLPLDDPRWRTYKGGYRVIYDASRPLRDLLGGSPSSQLWEELWNELHHQGDVDTASYAAVPWLVEFVRQSNKLDWNPLAIVAMIELERPRNPAVPQELAERYDAALRSLPRVLGAHPDQTWDELLLRAAVTCIALAHGNRWFAQACFELDHNTAARWFSEEFGWEFDGS